MEKVSVIVCTFNSEMNIKEVLESIKKNNPLEIILVDGKSTDNTIKIAMNYCDLILSDDRNGLAEARNIGISKAQGEYIFFVGSDNVLPEGTIDNLLSFARRNKLVCVGAMQRVINGKNKYFQKSLNFRFKLRFIPGITTVVGTPSLYRGEILREFQFNNKMSYSDDAEQGSRLTDARYKIGYSDFIVYEIGTTSLRYILNKWKNYGRSDYEIYTHFRSNWSLKRRLSSITYPFRKEFLFIFKSKNLVTIIFLVPFALIITLTRYYGWIISVIRKT